MNFREDLLPQQIQPVDLACSFSKEGSAFIVSTLPMASVLLKNLLAVLSVLLLN